MDKFAKKMRPLHAKWLNDRGLDMSTDKEPQAKNALPDIVQTRRRILGKPELQKGPRWNVLINATRMLGIRVRNYVEIGVHRGRMSQTMVKALPQAQHWLIDPWRVTPEYSRSRGSVYHAQAKCDAHRAHVMAMFADAPNVHILRMTSTEAAQKVPDGLDLVFIDANHDRKYVEQDIRTWLPKVKRGALLCGHDYHVFESVRKAVDGSLSPVTTVIPGDVWLHVKE